MSVDISAELRAASTRAGWEHRDVLDTLRAICRASERCVIDWDDDAGEEWGRVLDGDVVVGLVSSRLPLVVVRSHEEERIEAVAAGLVSIAVPDLDANELRADRDALVEAFPDIAGQLDGDRPVIKPERFSALDLWYATV